MAVGRLDVDEVEREISNAQYREWVEFFNAEPWGSEVDFLRAGIVAAAVVNSSANRKPGSKPVSPADFMLKPKREAVKADRKEMRAALFGVFGRDSQGKKADG